MKTSVIIPTINRPDSLKVLLYSLARGTTFPDEVVIIEQGDATETRRNVGSYSLPFLVSIYEQDEKSSAVARNRGAQESTGDIIFFFDDDTEVGTAYIETAQEYLHAYPQTLGLTGRFTKEVSRALWRRLFGIFFNVYSWRARNIVLPSGSYDFIRGAHAKEEQALEWMRGGNMVFRRAIFDEGFHFNTHFKKWAFGEDVMFTFQIYKQHPNSLRYLPNLQIQHHEEQENKMLSEHVLKMKIVYRYIFWKREVWQGKWWRTLAYLWSQIGLSLLDISQYPCFRTLRILARAYWYILKNGRAILTEQVNYNAFIFSDEAAPKKKEGGWWRISIFGVFPFVRFRQMLTYPPFFIHYLKRLLYYNYISHRYIPKYKGFTFLSPQETLCRIIDGNMSLARFGDGDIEQLTGAGEYPPDSDWSQRASASLIRKIEVVLSSKNNNLLIAPVSPEVFLERKGKAQKTNTIYNMWVDMRMLLWRYMHKGQEYGDANVFIPAHHPDLDWRKLKEFMRNKTVLIITGGVDSLSDISLGRHTFFIEAGKHDAFERYETIVADIYRCIEINSLHNEELLIMASLGPTAGILAHDLSQKGYQVWDTGHIFKFAHAQLTQLSHHE